MIKLPDPEKEPALQQLDRKLLWLEMRPIFGVVARVTHILRVEYKEAQYTLAFISKQSLFKTLRGGSTLTSEL